MRRHITHCFHIGLLCARTDASLSGRHDGGLDVGHGSSSVQSKRLRVLNTWRENQQLEEDLKEMPVASVTTTAVQRCIKDLKVVGDELSVSKSNIVPFSSHVQHSTAGRLHPIWGLSGLKVKQDVCSHFCRVTNAYSCMFYLSIYFYYLCF